MNKIKINKQKGEYYYELENGIFCCFHTDNIGNFSTGHCFATFMDKIEAQEWCKRQNEEIKKKLLVKNKVIEAVNLLLVGNTLDLENLGCNKFKSVKFIYTPSENWYSWYADTKGSVISYYPMRSNNYIKIFKTLKNAKLNFIKTLFKE